MEKRKKVISDYYTRTPKEEIPPDDSKFFEGFIAGVLVAESIFFVVLLFLKMIGAKW